LLIRWIFNQLGIALCNKKLQYTLEGAIIFKAITANRITIFISWHVSNTTDCTNLVLTNKIVYANGKNLQNITIYKKAKNMINHINKGT